MKKVTAILLLFIGGQLKAQQPPSTDIFLFDLSLSKKNVELRNGANITQRKGYDNQPFFHPDKNLLYYASAHDDGRTDIKIFNINDSQTKSLTSTPEREYSPTVTPDKKYISCIIQRDNGEQNLGKYPIEGGEPIILINDLVVGYHAWVNNQSLIAFILGQPNSLHFIDLEKKTNKILAQNIGRSLHKIPNENAMSFIQKNDNDTWKIFKLDKDLNIIPIAETVDGKDHDIAWTPDGKIISSMEGNLFFFDTKKSKKWTKISLPETFNATMISRIAINSKGNKIALVMTE